jgi:hypothetical protein
MNPPQLTGQTVLTVGFTETISGVAEGVNEKAPQACDLRG